MDTPVKEVVREMTRASDEERISFPEVVKALMAVGVERYHADLITGTKIYFMPDGSHEPTSSYATAETGIAFSAKGVEQAVRAVQRGEIGYRTFCDRIAAAGCVGYLVSLVGQQVLYYGRSNENHVEWFPGAKP
ncbi:DUF1398 family protein [Labrys okinawensis]|uniref:DUF1398 family protein n=1 Tax=Labrys okinawensis TaxID=346911 RepID=UPI0039BC98FE